MKIPPSNRRRILALMRPLQPALVDEYAQLVRK